MLPLPLYVSEYYDYPDDLQGINIMAESYAFQNNLLNVSFTPSCTPDESDAECGELSDGYAKNCLLTFDNHIELCVLPPVTVIDNPTGTIGRGGPFSPVWNYINNSYTINFFTPGNITFPQAFVTLEVQRESSGITYRLAFPVMLLLLLVGLSFWSESGARVDTTINILLAVSALYIVIFSSIPMLAYLTVFDYYILAVGVLSCPVLSCAVLGLIWRYVFAVDVLHYCGCCVRAPDDQPTTGQGRETPSSTCLCSRHGVFR